MAGIDPVYTDARTNQSVFARARHRLLPRTLFGRSLLIIALPMILLQLIVAFIFFDRIWDSTSNRVVAALAGEIAYINNQMQDSASAAERKRIAEIASDSLGMTIEVIEENASLGARAGDPFARYAWFSPGAMLQRQLEQRISVPFVLRPYERARMFVIEVEYAQGRMFRVLSHERRLLSSTTYIFFIWLIGSAFILFSVSMLFMRNQIRPILRLAVAAEKFGKGQDVSDFKPVGATEVRTAARAFVLMRDRLRRQIEQRTLMLAGVSHDLRTPLTRMKLQLVMMPQGSDRQHLEQDISEMENMVEGYLAFAKGAGDEPTSSCDLAALIERVVTNATREGHNVTRALPLDRASLTIKLRPIAIERALANLVGNACRFGKTVKVTAGCEDGNEAVLITIDDDGPGIAPDNRDDVFKPFYRVEKSRNKKTGGVGLGLSIAQDIILGHGGDIVLGDSPLGGLRVSIRLPA